MKWAITKKIKLYFEKETTLKEYTYEDKDIYIKIITKKQKK